jgi:hypothetical protein
MFFATLMLLSTCANSILFLLGSGAIVRYARPNVAVALASMPCCRLDDIDVDALTLTLPCVRSMRSDCISGSSSETTVTLTVFRLRCVS